MSKIFTPFCKLFIILQLLVAFHATAQPKITSFSPASGPVGSTVTITGMNFNATPSANTVFFGSVQAPVTGGSTTSLTVTVPGGTTYQPLTVLNTATGLTAYSAAPFITTFTNPFGTGFPPNYYQPPVNLTTEYAPASVDIADLDGDGKPDLVVGNFTNVSVFRNVSTPGSITAYSFANKLPVGTGGYGNTLTLADVDGDGKPDMIALHGSPNDIAVLRNTSTPGNIGFAAPVSKSTLGRSSRVSVRDLDGDGKPEIVYANYDLGTVSVLRNQCTPGTISFGDQVNFATGSNPSNLIINDLNGDGKPELVAVNGTAVSIFRNTTTVGDISASSFAAKYDLGTSSNAYSVAISDFNADGKPDLALVSGTPGNAPTLSVFQNATPPLASTFTFAAKVDFAVGADFSNLTVADLDGDGRPDLFSYSNGILEILRNTADAGSAITASSFAPRADFGARSYNSSAIAGDLDGDGIPEIISLSSSEYTASITRISSFTAGGAPKISAVSPLNGPVGTTVTIAGSNFNATPAGNIVYFGATRALVTAATSTSLTVTVPTGATYQPISVQNADNGLTGYSILGFDVTFRTSINSTEPLPQGFYRSKTDFAAGTLPFYVALRDLDGDGKADLIVANPAGTVSVLRNTGTSGSLNASSFGTRTELPVGSEARSIATGDLDGDGKPDIVVANANDKSLSVLRNISTTGTLNNSSFAPEIRWPVGATPYSVALGDIDGDGKTDLIAANFADGTVSVLRNTSTKGSLGAGSFAIGVSFPAGAFPRAVAVNDLNGDGKPDIAVVNEKANTVSILRNLSASGAVNAASLAAPVSFATGNSPNCIAVSDLDNDGKADLTVSNYGSNTVSVLRSTAIPGTIDAGSFAAKSDFATGPQPFFVSTGDADGDGRPDILVANAGSGSLSVLRNTTFTGNPVFFFQASPTFFSGAYPVAVAMGDVDGDNAPELISANAGANTVSILKIAYLSAAPVITSFSPASGPAGTQVTITGSNLSASSTVYFGTEVANITGTTFDGLIVSAPAGATYRPVSVINFGQTGFSSKPFVTTFNNPFGTGIPSNFYKPRVDIPSGNANLYAVAFGDMDKDGKLDLVGVDKTGKTISVQRNVSATGTITPSSFAPALKISISGRPQDVIISDIDGDSRLDILTVNPEDNSFTIIPSQASAGEGSFPSYSFLTPVTYPAGTYISSLAVGDLDGDGKPDVVTTNLYAGTVSVLRNLSYTYGINTYTFASKVDFAAGDFPRSVAISDVDGDGRRDLVVANERGNSVSVFRNLISFNSITPGSFAPRVDFPAGTNPPSVAIGDVDGDDKPDIVVANYGSSSVSVLRNTTTTGTVNGASFAAKVDFNTGSNPFHIAMGDADGDGKVDLVTANSTANTISVLRNTSTMGSITAASFAGKADFGTSGYPLNIALGDLDGDGMAEAAAANASNGTVSVFKINSPVAAGTAAATAGMLSATTGEPVGTAMQLYPNPTRGEFTVQLTGVKGSVAGVEVFSENGKAVEKRTVNTGGKAATLTLRLSLRHQPAGVYYVKITGVDGVQVVKVVVQR